MLINGVNPSTLTFSQIGKKSLKSAFAACGLTFLVLNQLLCVSAVAQVDQSATNDSSIGNNSNQNNVNQNANQNQNVINYPDHIISPLDSNFYTPVNTENDFGFNFSAGVNTLDSSNVTLYMGVIFQPGRTASHNARMIRLRKETEILEVQKQTLEARLLLLQKQVKEAGLQLNSAPNPTSEPEADSLPKAQGL